MAAIIEKLTSVWKDFKSYLKHKIQEISLENLIIKLQVKEANKNDDKKSVITVAKANIVEYSKNSKNEMANKNKLRPKK